MFSIKNHTIYILIYSMLFWVQCKEKANKYICNSYQFDIKAAKSNFSRLGKDNKAKDFKEVLDTIIVYYIPHTSNGPKWKEMKNYSWKDHKWEDLFYIEAASKELVIPYESSLYDCRLRLIGRFSKEKRLPLNNIDSYQVEIFKSNVFRYYSYQIIFPMEIYPPHRYQDEKTEMKERIHHFMIYTRKGKAIAVYNRDL